MRLRIFSVVGEALNFAGRRMETIMRVAWLPVTLILILEMATVFALLSVAYNRIITFEDVGTWARAEQLFQMVSTQIGMAVLQVGPQNIRDEIYWTLGLSTLVNAVLVSSFMAPLIRLAGVGDEPRPGVVRLAFGPDQIRYLVATALSAVVSLVIVFGPLAVTGFYALQYVLEAVRDLQLASFPDPESLHTVDLVNARDVLFSAASLEPLAQRVPLLAGAPLAVAFGLLLTLHFSPKNRGVDPARPNSLMRAGITFSALAAFIALIWLVFLSGAAGVAPDSTAGYAILVIILLVIIFYYFNLRLLPYAGVAVNRRSMAPAGLLRVTRGTNIVRLLGVLVAIGVVIYCVQYLLNAIAFPAIQWTIAYLYAATDAAARLTQNGEPAGWVLPFFSTLWNAVKILLNIFWTFFSLGVVAGYLGRLYRDSEGIDAPAPWRRGRA